MDTSREFLLEYRKTVLGELPLPDFLLSYEPVSCLKDGRRKSFLLRSEDGKLYVLKLQPSGCSPSLEQEFQFMQSLSHPQIPKVLCFLSENNTEYMLREYIPGLTLQERVLEQSPLEITELIAVMLSLCHVLGALHSRTPPVIHRDIKPQNIVLSPEGVCYLIDFGTARRFKVGNTEDTVFMGTRATASPEQFGYHQTDVRSDIYSMGMLMRFLLTGGYDPPSAEAAPKSLRKLISRCTAFDPKKRFSSVAELGHALRLAPHQRALFLSALAAAAVLSACLFVWSLLPADGPYVQLESSLLECAVRMELALPPDIPIPSRRLNEITELLICGQEHPASPHLHDERRSEQHDLYTSSVLPGDIIDLSPLSEMPNLRVLILDYQNISDLSPLSGLPLEQLSLAGNQITDLSPLATCKALSILDLAQNPINDISALSALPALKSVNLNSTSVRTLEPLENSAIQELHIWETDVGDLSPLRSFSQLSMLEAGNLDNTLLAEVGQLSSLQSLWLRNCAPFDDFKIFSSLQYLQEMDVCGCSYSSMSGLENLPNLNYLNLSSTNTIDLSALSGLPALVRLDLRDIPALELSPLLACRLLRTLILDETQQRQAESQLQSASFQIEFRPQ